MKRFVKLSLLLPLFALTLSGCSTFKEIEKEQYLEELARVEQSISVGFNSLDQLKINSHTIVKDEYDYKAGEFYCYKYFVLALIVPVTRESYVYKDEGKYIHSEYYTIESQNYCKEVNEESFNAALINGRNTMKNFAMQHLNGIKANINDEYSGDGMSDIEKHYYFSESTNEYKFVFSYNMEVDSKKEKRDIIYITKDSFPSIYETKTDGKTSSKYVYTYDDASMITPPEKRETEQAS